MCRRVCLYVCARRVTLCDRISPDVADFATYSTSNTAVPIVMAAKAPADGESYLFAAAARNGTTTVTFALAGNKTLSVCARARVGAGCDDGLRADRR